MFFSNFFATFETQKEHVFFREEIQEHKLRIWYLQLVAKHWNSWKQLRTSEVSLQIRYCLSLRTLKNILMIFLNIKLLFTTPSNLVRRLNRKSLPGSRPSRSSAVVYHERLFRYATYHCAVDLGAKYTVNWEPVPRIEAAVLRWR